VIYLELFWSFFKIGAFSFGGGYAMIPLIEKEIIDIHGWLPIDQFLDIIAISQMTPGPIAINAATFVGYRVAGTWGSVVSTLGVTAPSFILILTLAFLIIKYRNLPLVDKFFIGVRPVVIALIVHAGCSVAQRSFTGVKDLMLAAAVFGALYLFKINPILIIAGAAAAGILIY